MFASFSSLFLLSALVAAPALATPQVQRRSHNEVARRMEGNISKRGAFSNARMTWYPTDTGPDACTGKNHGDNDWLIAINIPQYGNGENCGKQVRITYGGKTTVATVADECASCPTVGQIDLTKGLFEFFGNPDIGELYGSWSFVDGNSGDNSGNDNEPKTTKKTTHKAAPTTTYQAPKTTSTPKKEFKATTTKKSTTSSKPSSSAKPSSSSKPSSSKVSSTPASSTPASSTVPYVTPSATSAGSGGVANAGSGPGSDSDTTSGDTSGIAGGISSGSSNGAESLTFNKVVAGATALVLLAVQVL